MEICQYTQRMRKDQGNTLDPELKLYHAAFMSYAFHYQYQLVEGITRRGDVVEICQYTQKMRKDQGNTLDPELKLYHAAFMSYAFH